MALIECKDCKKQFSTDAKKCPQCGAKKHGKSGAWLWIVGIIILVAMIGGGNKKPATPERYAKLSCREFVKRSLNDPGSAKFEPVDNYTTLVNKDGGYTVYVTLRAKNAFGALIKGAYACVVENGHGEWRLVSLTPI